MHEESCKAHVVAFSFLWLSYKAQGYLISFWWTTIQSWNDLGNDRTHPKNVDLAPLSYFVYTAGGHRCVSWQYEPVNWHPWEKEGKKRNSFSLKDEMRGWYIPQLGAFFWMPVNGFLTNQAVHLGLCALFALISSMMFHTCFAMVCNRRHYVFFLHIHVLRLYLQS